MDGPTPDQIRASCSETVDLLRETQRFIEEGQTKEAFEYWVAYRATSQALVELMEGWFGAHPPTF